MTKAHLLPEEDQLRALAARIDKPLVLVGMMGVGKSSVGRKLAQVLGRAFADADDAIVEAAHMPITDIFDQFGEAHFRDGERRVIARLLERPDTRSLILERGIAIWLQCDVDTLVERVGRTDKRPLLRGGDPRMIIEQLLAARTPAYAQAQIHVTSGRGPHSDTIGNILEALNQWL